MEHFLKSYRERNTNIFSVLVTAAVLVVTMVVIIFLFQRVPPRSLTISTASEDSAYYQFAKRYQKILAQHGIKLNVVTSSGALENIARLRDAASGVSAAFVQGGVTSIEKAPELASLGAMFYEPIWGFHRGPVPRRGRQWTKGLRISVGPEGGGTRQLSLELLEAVGGDLNEIQLLSLSPQAAADALTRGEIDMMLYVANWASPVPRRLLTAKGIRTLSFERADAQIALRPYLNKVVLPEGAADLARNLPPADLVLLAPKASLVVRKDMHPALQYVLLDAANQVHAIPGIFHVFGQFPTDEAVDLPLSPPADSYYKSGSPLLQRYMPFWVAVLVTQILFVLIPIFGVAYPLLRFLPALYAWGMRRRVFNLYGELKFLEATLEARGENQPVGDLLVDLDRLEQHANHMHLPVAYSQLLYTLRNHIGMVRTRLEEWQHAREESGIRE